MAQEGLVTGVVGGGLALNYMGSGSATATSGNTHISIGDKDNKTSPVVLGTVGGGVAVGLMGNAESNAGNVTIDINSGNALGVVGGGMAVGAGFKIGKTSAQDISININGTANAAGIFGGGAGIEAGIGVAQAQAENSVITINSTAPREGAIDSITAGIFGGGLAVGAAGGSTEVSLETAQVVLNSGLSMGMFGGGLSINSHLTPLSQSEAIKGLLSSLDSTGLVTSALSIPATSVSNTVKSTDIAINSSSSAVGIVGGGVALLNNDDDTKGKNASASSAVVDNAHIAINTSGFKAEDKTKLVSFANAAAQLVENKFAIGGGSGIVAAFKDLQGVQGAALGVLGGGIAIENMTGICAANTLASATTTKSTIDITNGYVVGTFAGGLAFASDKNPDTKGGALVTGETASINIRGGESVGVFGNGIAFFTAANGQDSQRLAIAQLDTSNITVSNGSVDGLYAGGIAIDDTAASYTNAQVITGTSNIVVNGGTVNVMNSAVLQPFVDKLPADPNTQTGNRAPYAHDYGQAFVDGTKDAAIVGGGFAIGKGAKSTITNSNITLNGGKIVGFINGDTDVTSNIYGGGIASHGGTSHVENANITIAGGDLSAVDNIYAGGIALTDSRMDQTALAEIYQKGTATVAKGIVTFLDNAQFKGTVVGSGVVKAITGSTTLPSTDSLATVTSSTLAFGDATHKYDATFSGAFKDFDNITVAKGSSVNLGVLTTEDATANLTKATTNFNGEGTVEAKQLIVKSSKNITIANGVVKITGATVGDIQNHSATAISVNRAGVLEIDKSAVLAATETPKGENAYDLATVTNGNLSQFTVTSGGVIKLNGFGENSLNEKQAANIKKDLLADDSAGMINFGKDVITFIQEPDGTVKEDLVATAGAIAEGETVKVNATGAEEGKKTANIAGGYGADAIKVDGASKNDTVTATVQKDLTLLGTADGKLVDAGGAKVDIELAKDKALNLGSAGATSHNASIDSVKLGMGDSAVNAAAAKYTVKGNIEGSAGKNGTVTASAGGTLEVKGNIGTAENNNEGSYNFLKEVKAEGGNISVGGALHAYTVTATGGAIVANDVRPTNIALDKGGTLITEKTHYDFR